MRVVLHIVYVLAYNGLFVPIIEVRQTRVLCDLDIYKDSLFAYFRSMLDSTLKDLHQKGVGTSKKWQR